MKGDYKRSVDGAPVQYNPQGVNFGNELNQIRDRLREKFRVEEEIKLSEEAVERITSEIKKDIIEEIQESQERIIVSERDHQEAKSELKEFLRLKLEDKDTEVTETEIMEELQIPADQTNELMEEIMEEGL